MEAWRTSFFYCGAIADLILQECCDSCPPVTLGNTTLGGTLKLEGGLFPAVGYIASDNLMTILIALVLFELAGVLSN